MKLCLKILAIAVVAVSTISMIGCAAAPNSFTYQNIGFTFSAQCTNCPAMNYNPAAPWTVYMPNAGQGGVMWLTAAVTNAPPNITWALWPQPNLSQPNPPPTGTSQPVGESGSQVGVINSASGNTAFFTQNGVPVYTGAALTQAENMHYTVSYQEASLTPIGTTQLTTVTVPVTGIPQGDILFSASVPSDPFNPSAVATGYQVVQMYNNNSSTGPPSVYLVPKTPTVPSGLTTSVATVPRNTSYAFYGGAVGAYPCLPPSAGANCSNGSPGYTADNTVVWEVGDASAATSCSTAAVQGGSTAWGTISSTGVYTAPAAIPSGFVCVVMASHAQPTVTAIAYITID